MEINRSRQSVNWRHCLFSVLRRAIDTHRQKNNRIIAFTLPQHHLLITAMTGLNSHPQRPLDGRNGCLDTIHNAHPRALLLSQRLDTCLAHPVIHARHAGAPEANGGDAAARQQLLDSLFDAVRNDIMRRRVQFVSIQASRRDAGEADVFSLTVNGSSSGFVVVLLASVRCWTRSEKLPDAAAENRLPGLAGADDAKALAGREGQQGRGHAGLHDADDGLRGRRGLCGQEQRIRFDGGDERVRRVAGDEEGRVGGEERA